MSLIHSLNWWFVKSRLLFFLLLIFTSCDLFGPVSPPTCDPLGIKPVLKVIQNKAATQCSNPDGEFEVEAIGGKGPFRFSIGEEKMQFDGAFKNLFAGEYRVKVTDANNCEGFLNVAVPATSNVFQASVNVYSDDGCSYNSGRIIVKATGGIRPLLYQLDERTFQTDSVFYQLDKGFYQVKVKDANGCQYQLFARVEHGDTGTSYSNKVQPVISQYCSMAGCHNGDVGVTTNFTQFNIVKSYGTILVRYASMQHRQPPLPKQQLDLIRCWVEDGTPNN
jgi:hypothetical protein